MLWDYVLSNKEGLVGNETVGCSLGCRDNEMVEFRILCGRNKAIRIATLDFRKACFDLFKDLLRGILWLVKWPKRAVWHSNTTSSDLKNSAS